MLNFLICLFISVSLSYGMAILLVEKGKDFPIRKPRLILKRLIRKYISKKWSKVLDCSTCSSFWTTLIADIVLCIISGGTYFFWPFSGFICAGIMWTIIEVLNSMDKDRDINVFIDNKGDNDEN